MLRIHRIRQRLTRRVRFNGHPPLGVNATMLSIVRRVASASSSFNGHPPLGVNATGDRRTLRAAYLREFQWAPTLGGECYKIVTSQSRRHFCCFNGHPPLGVNATGAPLAAFSPDGRSFNGHPPLGVNATCDICIGEDCAAFRLFQWAPTLGGECYRFYTGTIELQFFVSMGTHPWG